MLSKLCAKNYMPDGAISFLHMIDIGTLHVLHQTQFWYFFPVPMTTMIPKRRKGSSSLGSKTTMSNKSQKRRQQESIESMDIRLRNGRISFYLRDDKNLNSRGKEDSIKTVSTLSSRRQESS